jgi:NADP-dependent 3-hydroxy acid dehydrogenase YdfG
MARRVLVIGAAGGIGSALVRRLVASGGKVFLAGRDATRLETLATELGMPWGTVEATDPDAIDGVADRAVAELGGLDGLANCVGSILLKPAHLTSAADWNATIATNLTSAFGCVRAAGRLMKGEGGSVVLVSSAAARVGLANHEAIAAAKGIPLQHEAMSASSGTDTDVIFWTRGGIPSALISLPNRYMHSPVELVNLRDLEYIPELMAAFALSLRKDEEFKVRI